MASAAQMWQTIVSSTAGATNKSAAASSADEAPGMASGAGTSSEGTVSPRTSVLKMELELCYEKMSHDGRVKDMLYSENVDLRGRMLLCKSLVEQVTQILANYDMPDDAREKLERFLRNLVPARDAFDSKDPGSSEGGSSCSHLEVPSSSSRDKPESPRDAEIRRLTAEIRKAKAQREELEENLTADAKNQTLALTSHIADLIRARQELQVTSTHQRGAASSASSSQQCWEKVDRANPIASAIDAVCHAMEASGSESDTMCVLAAALAEPSQMSAAVHTILEEFGWLGKRFHSPPDLEALLQRLQQSAKDAGQKDTLEQPRARQFVQIFEDAREALSRVRPQKESGNSTTNSPHNGPKPDDQAVPILLCDQGAWVRAKAVLMELMDWSTCD